MYRELSAKLKLVLGRSVSNKDALEMETHFGKMLLCVDERVSLERRQSKILYSLSRIVGFIR